MFKLHYTVLLMFFIPFLSACKSTCSFPIVKSRTIKTDNAILIVLAYPEEVVRTTEAFYSNLLPLIGMGKKGSIRAGHAAMVLVKNGSKEFEYYDFGRYITPEGYSRMRSRASDPETKIDVKPRWKGDELVNVEELLQWLYDHPEKTKGIGDLYASLSTEVNYERVKEYIKIIEEEELLEYGPFVKNGSNCARFVTGAMYHGIMDEELQKKVRKLYHITPSGLGNVDAANSLDNYFVVNEDEIFQSNKDLDKIQRDIIFDWGKGHQPLSEKGTLSAPKNAEYEIGENWQWLGGFGSGGWFDVKPTQKDGFYLIAHYNALGECVFKSVFKTKQDLDVEEPFTVTYPSHFRKCTLIQDDEEIILQRVKKAKRYVSQSQLLS
ncbi:DUF6695 family protein [Aureibacter tunicatorum]|uniref:Lipoprotein n=1 Tax=Aureibacter tunicatorum TaxID=866807 RepID=A0AAE3XS65_9BACT|nr:DUF6695 family protein [Aureibacter tunicatorum]MDR6240499.1 hypothetical protein [Aureibacter tunicatorum]BDD06638.1 hypothetical protein AUTU_41210 [Aureibacter tunicatorum]